MLGVTTLIAIWMSKKDSKDGVWGCAEAVFDIKGWANMLTGVLWPIANVAVPFSNQVNGVDV
uniref:hypothetical protein n=1 Tax=Olsenella uli TaxID=133926 RepID=UPI0028E8EF8E|nr:hypothetical protein [Olsenella uli]